MLKNHYQFTLSAYCLFLLLISFANNSIANNALWDSLKAGGKVILMRHAPVEQGSVYGNPLLRDPSCKNERNISNEGRHKTRLLAKKFREYNIPVSKVLHSPFCRTTDTAKIAFGNTKAADYISLIEILDPQAQAKQTEILNQVISSYANKGNLILVTHQPNINAISFELLKHLDILVIKPTGDGEFEELGVIKFSEME